MRWMSSQPSRDVMSQFGFIIVRHVATKSLAVIGLPSLQTALFLNVAVTVSGSSFTSLGTDSIRYGTSCAFGCRSRPMRAPARWSAGSRIRFPSTGTG